MMLGMVGLVAVLFSAQILGIHDQGAVTSYGDAPTPIPHVTQILVVSTTGSAGGMLGIPAPVTPVAVSPLPVTAAINGVPISRILVLTDKTRQNIRKIYSQGQALGRNAHAFSKVGDSTMVWPPFLAAFDDRRSYKLGTYAYLEPTIQYYAGSFGRNSIAARNGMHTWTEFDPAWVDRGACLPAEGPLACELRLNNPSVALIRLGANDTYAPKQFEEQLRKIVEYCIGNGVIPVLGTKPDRLEGNANTLNKSIQRLALELNIPLWDYDRMAATLPGRGLGTDSVHFLGIGTHDYSSRKAFASGDSLEDLTGLLMLDVIKRETDSTRAR
jgi:hypothetical protein